MTDDQILAKELPFWPGVTISSIESGKHRKTVLAFQNRTRFVVSPKTRGDNARGPMRFRTDVRKVCKELGATRI